MSVRNPVSFGPPICAHCSAALVLFFSFFFLPFLDTWQTRDRVFKGSWAQEPKLGGDDGKMVEQELTLTSAEEVVTVATDFPDSPEEELQKTNPQAALSWTLNIHLEAQDKLQEVFQAMDADGSGKLSKIEVLRAVRDHETVVQMLQASPKLAGLMRPQSWQDAFRSFDTDNDDTITAEELRRFCLENVPDYATSLQLKASTYPVAMSDEGFSAGKTHSMSFLQLSFVKTADYVPPAE